MVYLMMREQSRYPIVQSKDGPLGSGQLFKQLGIGLIGFGQLAPQPFDVPLLVFEHQSQMIDLVVVDHPLSLILHKNLAIT